MTGTPQLSLTLIVKDEQESLPTLLESVEGAFDEIVMVDTGSKDKTVEIFADWAQQQVGEGKLGRYVCDSFEWCDDFSAARAYADSLASGQWIVWADADDVIRGASNIRELVAQMPEHVSAIVCGYQYAFDPFGNLACYLKRERIVRKGHGEWLGRVHEAQVFPGEAMFVGPEMVEWIHRKGVKAGESSPRNTRILKKWLKDEPKNPRVLQYLGTEELVRGKQKRAATYFRRYLKLKTGWDEERAQVHRKLGAALMGLGQHEEAIALAFEAMRLLPTWPDSYLTLAEAHYQLGEPAKAQVWAEQVIAMGTPDTMLIVNPQEYEISPRVVLAGALAQLGDLDRAIHVGDYVLERVPEHPVLAGPYRAWRMTRKRESTASTVCGLAELLVEHDEQLKAFEVLKNAPYYCQDHPKVVALRSHVRERVEHLFDRDEYAHHYETGGSKPEDFVADPLEVGDQLPRCAFLLQGLTEQAEELAA